EAKYAGDWMLHCHLPRHVMNQMVSMVGPMMMSHGGGSQTGLGIQEGMGVVRQGHALSEDLGPGFGRGMGMTTEEKNVSNAIGAPITTQAGSPCTCPMHPKVNSKKKGKCPKCGMTLVKLQAKKIYACPMHREAASTTPGKCPKCGMTRVKKQVPGVALTEAKRGRYPATRRT